MTSSMSMAVRFLNAPLLRTGGLVLLTGPRISQRLTPRNLRTFAEVPGGQADGTGKKSGRGGTVFTILLGAGLGVGAYYLNRRYKDSQHCFKKYQRVYNEIAEILESDEKYDYGSYGPVFVRLAWHASGTYDTSSATGGSNFGTMRFDPEAKHGANAGLQVARDKLKPIREKFPWISYGDLWTLAGVVAIQQMGGPIIPWRPGRVDGSATDCPPDGRLPDGANPSPQHPRDIFYRMGFNDQEITALIGAHTLGKCHSDRSGYEGPWTASPTTFSNSFYTELLGKTWVEKKWSGPKQFEDKETGELMMLPADMAFLKDNEFKKWVEVYAKDESKFFTDFALAWKKLIELGVPFSADTPEFKFNLNSATPTL